jgi:hypothetical protein
VQTNDGIMIVKAESVLNVLNLISHAPVDLLEKIETVLVSQRTFQVHIECERRG